MVTDVLADAWDGVVMCMGAKALPIDSMIVGLTGSMIDMLSKGMVGFCVTVSTAVCMIVVTTAAIALELIVPFSYATDVRSGLMIDLLSGSGVVPNSDVDVLAGVDANMWASTMTALDSIPMLASSVEALVLLWEVCSCWATAAWNCVVLQAQMPSCHV